MSRIMDKALQGEPLTIVMSDQAKQPSEKAAADDLDTARRDAWDHGHSIRGRFRPKQTLKKKLKKELGASNIIAIGSAKTNGLIQALKPGIMQKSKAIGFDWKGKMNQKASSGAYVIKHPYNQNRLLLHFFWNGDALSDNAVEPFAEQMLKALNFSTDFYQYYVLNKTGHVATDRKIANPIAKLFGEE